MAQETGITRFIPCRDGALPLNSIAEAAQDLDSSKAIISGIRAPYTKLRESTFEATNVLADFIENATA